MKDNRRKSRLELIEGDIIVELEKQKKELEDEV
jgi:hypothetical protein